jgi:phosphate butyryltransferase
MIKQLKDILTLASEGDPLTIAVAGVAEEEIVLAGSVFEKKLARFILIGIKTEICGILDRHHISRDSFEIIDEADQRRAAALAVKMVRDGKAHIPMKGLIHTEAFMQAILDKEQGLRSGRRMSQITVFDGYNGELQFLTDCAISINPDLTGKKHIIENAVLLAQRLGFEMPLVALLGSVETVSDSMPDTIESAALTQMNRRGQITGCIVDGPLSLDNAISTEAASRKDIDSPVAGRAQIMVAPDLSSANTFSKALMYYAKKDCASVIMGTISPVIMTSRTDMLNNKILAIAASIYFFRQQQNNRVV